MSNVQHPSIEEINQCLAEAEQQRKRADELKQLAIARLITQGENAVAELEKYGARYLFEKAPRPRRKKADQADQQQAVAAA